MPMPFAVRSAVLIALALASSAVAPAAEVEVKLLGGAETVTGELASLGSDVAVVTPQGRKAVPGQHVLSVDFSPATPSGKPAVWVELIDGSKLQATQIAAEQGKAQVELVGGTKVEFPARSIRSVRFREQDADLSRQWREIGNSAAMAQGDVLVRRKTSQRTVEEEGADPKTVTDTALDQLEGTVLGIKADTIPFNFDGDVIPVNRDKVEGIYIYQPVKRELPSPTCKLVDAAGSQWSLKSVELRESGVAGVTTSNVSIVVPLEQVAKIDYSAGNVVFLGDAEPDNLEVSVGLQPSGMQAKFDRLYQSWQNRRFGAAALSLGGVKYSKGLGLAGGAEVSYRVPEGFGHFRALAGIDDTVEQVGGVTLTILADNKPLFSREFTSEDRGPAPIDLQVKGARRLTIVVTPMQSQGLGDLVNLCDARITK